MNYSKGKALLTLLLLTLACHNNSEPRSTLCFDDLRSKINGKTAQEIQKLLGEPDVRESMVLSGERWIWWNYTYLDGQNYPPEMRGQLVHLEIILDKLGGSSGEALRASDPLSVSYALSQKSR